MAVNYCQVGVIGISLHCALGLPIALSKVGATCHMTEVQNSAETYCGPLLLISVQEFRALQTLASTLR